MENPPPYETMKGPEQYPTPQQQYPTPQQQYPTPLQQYPTAQQQPGYGYNQAPQMAPQQMGAAAPQNNVTVNMGMPSNTVIIQNQIRPASYMSLACFIFWCCNPVMGGIAFIFSMLSSSAADENDLPRARSLGRVSMWLSLAGIIMTVVLIAIGVGVAVSAANDAVDTLDYALTSSDNSGY